MRRRRSASRNLQQACVFRKRSGFTFKHISVGVSITASLRFSVQAGKLKLPSRPDTAHARARPRLGFPSRFWELSTVHAKPESQPLRPVDFGTVAKLATDGVEMPLPPG